MPNYEYRCDDCNTSEEHYRNVDERDDVPNCQYCTRLTRRIINPVPFKLNGTGFYSTGG
jgi:putative FmdB family regulatory protein